MTVGSSGGVAWVIGQCGVLLGVVGIGVQTCNKIALKKHKKPFQNSLKDENLNL